MPDAVVVLTAGSTSLKFGAYTVDKTKQLPLLCRGQIDSMQGNPRFVAKDENGKSLGAHEWDKGHAIDHKTALRFVIAWLESNIAGMKVVAVGHRVVLGGARFGAPVRIEGDALDYLSSRRWSHRTRPITCSAHGRWPKRSRDCHRWPASTPRSIALCRMSRRFMRYLKMRATPGHTTGAIMVSPTNYISRQLPKYARAARRVIAAHLGGGTSMCAMLDGRSVETTMGFAGVSGLPMGTRSGDVPIDVLFYLLRSQQFDDTSLEQVLYGGS